MELLSSINFLLQEAHERGANQVLQSLKATFEEEKAIFVREAEERGEERGFNAARETVDKPMLGDVTAIMRWNKYESLTDFKAAKGKV